MSTGAESSCSKSSSPPPVRQPPPRGRRSGPRLRTVTVTRPRCPICDCVRLRKYRSVSDQGDGTALWWVKCAECEARFRVLLE